MESLDLIGVSEELLEELRRSAPLRSLKTLRELRERCERKLKTLRRTHPESREISYSGPINPADELDQIRFHQQVIDICNGQIVERGRMSMSDLERQRDALLEMFPALRTRRLTLDPPPEQERYDEVKEQITDLKLRQLQKTAAQRRNAPREPGQERKTDTGLPSRRESTQDKQQLLGRDPDLIKRLGIIAQNPKLNSQELCGRFDLASVPLPAAWTTLEAPVSRWSDAYRRTDLRKRIQTIISKEKRKLKSTTRT
jgi:hypothetical protein